MVKKDLELDDLGHYGRAVYVSILGLLKYAIIQTSKEENYRNTFEALKSFNHPGLLHEGLEKIKILYTSLPAEKLSSFIHAEFKRTFQNLENIIAAENFCKKESYSMLFLEELKAYEIQETEIIKSAIGVEEIEIFRALLLHYYSVSSKSEITKYFGVDHEEIFKKLETMDLNLTEIRMLGTFFETEIVYYVE